MRKTNLIVFFTSLLLCGYTFGQTYSAYSVANSANDQTIFVHVNPGANKVKMVITGKDNRYFAFGFNATAMAAQPYCIYTNASTALERKLGNHSAGTSLTPSITIKSNTTDAGVRTIELERSATPLNSNYYDFSGINGSSVVNYIWAHGSSQTFAYHGSNRGSNLLTFSQDQFDFGTLTVTACDSFVAPSCKVYTSSGTFQDTVITVFGNDSIYTLDLTINQNTSSTISVQECDSFIVPSGSQTLTSSGTFIDTIPNQGGCDSIITIDLTILGPDTSVTNSGTELTANQNGATYQWLNCDSNMAPISGEINQTFVPSVGGNYAVEITLNGCTDTSGCAFAEPLSINEEVTASAINVFPNPTNGMVNIHTNGTAIVNVVISDVKGRRLYIGQGQQVDFSRYNKGLYFVAVSTREKTSYFKVQKL